MATNRNNIFVPQMARVYLAAVGTVMPTDTATALAAAFVEVGLFTPDSLSWSADATFEEVRSHQSSYRTRNFQTEESATLEVDLQEWSKPNFLAVYGGGTVTSSGVAPNIVYRFEPPAIGGRTQTACVVELKDGTKTYRRCIPVCEQVEGVEQSFNKTSESTLPLRLSIVGNDTGAPWYDITNDPSWA